MKKIFTGVFILFSLFVCIVFSSCGENKYKNLSMYFCNVNGERLTSVDLVIDSSDNNSKNTMRVAVKFEGISNEDVGDVLIYASNNIAEISNYIFENNTCYVDITARMPTSGTLNVKHMASNKSASIPLNINLKADNLKLKSNNIKTYVISLSNPEAKLINANLLFDLYFKGSAANCADDIYFKTANMNNPLFITKEVDGQTYIVGFNVTDQADIDPIELYPVTYLSGYEPKEYEDIKVNFIFVNTLDESKLSIVADDLHNENLQNGEQIILISNTTYLPNQAKDDSKLNNISVKLMYDGQEDGLNEYLNFGVNNAGYDYFYNGCKPSEDNYFIVQADANNSSAQIVTLGLKAKNCVGDIPSVSKSFSVKSELKPSDISVSMQDKILTENSGIINVPNLYDYYQSGGEFSNYGAKFYFTPSKNSVSALRKMRISIEPKYINAYIFEMSSGTNHIYEDSGFNNEYDSIIDKNFNGQNVRSNKYMMEFYINETSMKFYYDPIENKFVSQTFSDTDKINIKAVYNSTLLGNDRGLYIETFNVLDENSTLEYLNNAVKVNLHIDFNYETGVEDIHVSAGNLTQNGADASTNLIHEKFANDNKIYLAVQNGQDSAAQNGAYILYLSEILRGGDVVNNIGVVNFDVSVIGGGQNPLKIKQWEKNDGIGKNFNNSLNVIGTNISYSYNSSVSVENSIIFVFNKNTDLGQYTIRFSQANGFVKDLQLEIYENFTSADLINYNLLIDSGNAFENDLNAAYNSYDKYDADYIVATNSKLNISFNISSRFTSTSIINRYAFAVLQDENSNSIDADNLAEYIQIEEQFDSWALIHYLQGTEIDGEHNYVVLRLTIHVNQYSDILTIGTPASYFKDIKFFIYDEIHNSEEDSDITLNVPAQIELYNDRYLGYYNRTLSQQDFIITLSNSNLWNYVQDYEQSTGFYKVTFSADCENPASVTVVEQYSNDAELKYGVKLKFSRDESEKEYITITLVIRQFNNTFSFPISVHIINPIITERVVIDGYKTGLGDNAPFTPGLNMRNGSPMLNLKYGGATTATYQIITENQSPNGDVTHKGVTLVVADNNGTINDSIISIEKNTLTIIEQGNITLNLKLYLFATDALQNQITGKISNVSELLKEGYENAYLIVDLILSNGSKDNPYLIYTADDFKDINAQPDGHYKLMNNINLSNADFIISNFSGSLISDYDQVDDNLVYYTYSVFGIKLNENRKNLFDSIALNAEITNINFVVEYNYQTAQNNVENLGVIAENNGLLENVTVSISGKNNVLNGDREAYFGGLVAINRGEIKYTSNEIIGAVGQITLSGEKIVYFGGLVGKNEGQINGYDKSSQTVNLNLSLSRANKVEFSVNVNNVGMISNVIIDAERTNELSAVGGLVGLNTNVINYAVVTGSVLGNCNVGGIIGKNQLTAKHVQFNIANSYLSEIIVENKIYDNFLIKNSTSSVAVSGRQNVGGVVGQDEGGSYYNTHYQATENSNIRGTANVGGIAGSSLNGVFAFCSVMSYKWDYGTDINVFDVADISGHNFVAGIVGNSNSNLTSVEVSGSSNATTIIYSSVNAYIDGTSDVAGLIANSKNISLVLDAYFMGKINNATEENVGRLIISNDKGNEYFSLFNRVYNRLMDTNQTTTYKDGQDSFKIKPNEEYETLDNWKADANINGGYMFIALAGKPIFELVPQTLDATVKGNYILTDTENLPLPKAIHLYYYDVEDNLHTNSYNILDLLNITAEPDTLDSIKVLASSSNDNVISVSYNNLTVRGVGNCTLTISSALKPSLAAEITVFVTLPFGDEFKVSTSTVENNLVDGGDVYIVKGGGQPLYVSFVTSGYSALINPYLKLEISYEGEEANYSNLISVAGMPFNSVINLPQTSEFSVVVNEYFEGYFEVKLTPYIQLELGDSVVQIPYEGSFSFKIRASQGATQISPNVHKQDLYPSETSSLKIYLTTDVEIDRTLVENSIKYEIEEEYRDNNEYVSLKLSFKDSQFDIANKNQVLTYDVIVERLKEFSTPQEVQIKFSFNEIYKTVYYRILPEHISNIIIENYQYVNGFTAETKKSPVLRPDERGLIVIDMDPINGYYDYVEIDDLTGGNLISFRQLDGVAGNRVNEAEKLSSTGLGIRLAKQAGSNSLFVDTRVGQNDSSRIHQIRVSAYLNDGTLLKQNFYDVNVKMLPEVNIFYRTPAGVETKNPEHENQKFYTALGVDTYIRVETKNADANPAQLTLSFQDAAGVDANDYLEIVSTYPGFYTLHYKNRNPGILLGKTVSITAKARATSNNGQFDEDSETINLLIVNFVIHDVSVTNSRTNNGQKEIFGNYNVPTQLEFYFAPQDISLYNGGFFNYTYRLNDETKGINSDVYNILQKLNNNTAGEENSCLQLEKTEEADISLINNVLTVASLTGNEKLKLNLTMRLQNSNWVIDSEGTGSSSSLTTSLTESYNFNFVNLTSGIHPDVITDEQDFITTAFAPGYYVLGNDLNLFNFTPIEVGESDGQIVFDGNGRRIIIHGFSEFNQANMVMGLFESIPSNMIVINLEVIYISEQNMANSYTLGYVPRPNVVLRNISYKNLFTNDAIDYSNANVSFGGVASVNNGIISNCTVSGYVALEASYFDAENQQIYADFNMGGLVAENYGTITHSTSKLGMFAHANIGGFTYLNGSTGKIVSCSFDASESFSTNRNIENYKHTASSMYASKDINKTGMIYAFVDVARIINVAGFVVENNGEIGMSYVNISNTQVGGSAFENIESNYEFSGFVLNNSQLIYDCYSIVDTMEQLQVSFSGFVVNNGAGTIRNSYSYITFGIHKNWRAVSMFIARLSDSKGTLINCFEINSDNVSDDDLVKKIDPSELANKNKYENFSFGDNKNSIWTINGSTPQLVSTLNLVNYDDYQLNDTLNYYGLRRVDIDPATGEFTISNNGYGNINNPILIYDVNEWNTYFADKNSAYSNKYYRIINDINFTNNIPQTSTTSFSGNIQGNFMSLNNILLYSTDNLSAIGLFKEIVGTQDVSVANAISNLTLNISSVKAQQTTAVGVLAGVIENFNLYNISLGSNVGSENVINGGNAVGALAGIIRGSFDIENISSSLNIFSAYEFSQTNRYNLYLSKNNGKDVSSNLNMVYYSGGIAGIVDGFDRSNANEKNKYFEIRGISLDNVSVNGLIVGSGFGLVGERVKLIDASVNLSSGYLSGLQYSAGLVGENRGIVSNSSITATSSNLFENSINVSAGVVGINLGGLVINTHANIDIVKESSGAIVGGIVGKNINGNVVNCNYNGNINGFITGGIVGANYTKDNLINASTGPNTIFADTADAVPDKQIKYADDNENEYAMFENNTISNSTLQYWFDKLENFYSLNPNVNNYFDAITRKKVLGLLVGLQSEELEQPLKVHYGFDENYNFVFNSSYFTQVGKVTAPLYNGKEYELPYLNVAINPSLTSSHVMYVIGATTNSYDSWENENYSNEIVVFTASNDNNLELSSKANFKIYYAISETENEFNYNIQLLSGTADSQTINVNLSCWLSLFNEKPTVSVNNTETELNEGNILQANLSENSCSIKLTGTKLNGEEELTITLNFTLTN